MPSRTYFDDVGAGYGKTRSYNMGRWTLTARRVHLLSLEMPIFFLSSPFDVLISLLDRTTL